MTTTIRGTDNSAAAPALTGNDSDTGIYFPAANKLGLVTGGTERVIVDDLGNVGIGTSSPTNVSNYNSLTINDTTGSFIDFQSNGTTGGRIQTDTTYPGMALFALTNQPMIFGTNGTERMRLNATGNLAFVNGNGIDFSASAGGGASSSLLDDYEEGTFDPTAEGDITTGTCSYSLRTGRYTKIGRLVTFQLTVGWSGHTGTGTLVIEDLPFVAISGIAGQSVASIGYTNGLSWTSVLQLYIGGGGTKIVFVQSTTGGSISGIPVDANVTELIINGHYITS